MSGSHGSAQIFLMATKPDTTLDFGPDKLCEILCVKTPQKLPQTGKNYGKPASGNLNYFYKLINLTSKPPALPDDS